MLNHILEEAQDANCVSTSPQTPHREQLARLGVSCLILTSGRHSAQLRFSFRGFGAQHARTAYALVDRRENRGGGNALAARVWPLFPETRPRNGS